MIATLLSAVPASATAEARASEVACRNRPTLSHAEARSLDTDGLPLWRRPPVPLDDALQWGPPAYDHPSWIYALHGLEWTYALIDLALDGDVRARELLEETYSSWQRTQGTESRATVPQAWHVHPVALRTGAAACAVAVLGLPEAEPVLAGGIEWMMRPENDDGDWNHGVDQALTLFVAGCASGDTAVADHAVERLHRHRRNAVDRQGVTNEQAPAYQRYVMAQYGEIITRLDACGYPTGEFRRARAAMLPMVVHATRPNGYLAEFGDTGPRSSGRAPAALGTEREAELAAVYERGFAFARDGWGHDATWLGMRFGDARVIHGHRDHTSILYDVMGVPVLAEGGHAGYRPGAMRDWQRSHPAHNVVTVRDGGRFLWDNPTPVVRSTRSPNHMSLVVEGTPYAAVTSRRRAVLVSFDPHFVVVRDEVSAPGTVTTDQLWHLPEDWEVHQTTPSRTVASGPDGLGLQIVQLDPLDGVDLVTGAATPLQGHVTGPQGTVPAPVVSFSHRGRSIRYTTVLVPTGKNLPELDVTTRGGSIIVASASRTRAISADDRGHLLATRFTDTATSVFVHDIEWLAASGLTTGCNPPTSDQFCPGDVATRGEIAAFLRRALDLRPSRRDVFRDDDGIFERDIQALAAAGITAGCNPPTNDRFCPDDHVTRGQMAALLRRALDLPGSRRDIFDDTDRSVFDRDIAALAAAGVTAGCNPPLNDRFCPEDPVTRGQLAAFLQRALR